MYNKETEQLKKRIKALEQQLTDLFLKFNDHTTYSEHCPHNGHGSDKGKNFYD